MDGEWVIAECVKKSDKKTVELNKEEQMELLEAIFDFKSKLPEEGNPFWVFFEADNNSGGDRTELTLEKVMICLEKKKTMFVMQYIWDKNREPVLTNQEKYIHIKTVEDLIEFFNDMVKEYFLASMEDKNCS